MQLTIRDVSQLLNVSERSIYRWIKSGTIPFYRISDQYRFNRSELIDWASRNKINVSPEIFIEPQSAVAMPGLVDALNAGGVFYRVSARDKNSALKAVVDLLRIPDERERSTLLNVLLARESLASTGIGEGIAIPHARNPIILDVPTPMICLCFLEQPIEFDALDEKPVHCLFTIICSTTRTHLHLISRLAFALRDPEFARAIAAHGSREEILAQARRVDETMQSRRQPSPEQARTP